MDVLSFGPRDILMVCGEFLSGIQIFILRLELLVSLELVKDALNDLLQI